MPLEVKIVFAFLLLGFGAKFIFILYYPGFEVRRKFGIVVGSIFLGSGTYLGTLISYPDLHFVWGLSFFVCLLLFLGAVEYIYRRTQNHRSTQTHQEA